MKYKFLDNETTYYGTELRSSFINEVSGLIDNAIVAFIGPADVELKHMVDLDDVKKGVGIKSKLMLHFIIQHKDVELQEMVWRQRLFICICKECLNKKGVSRILRKGDDLFIDDKKLSVSIATSSDNCSLIHTGINIDADLAPVPAIGLNQFGVDPKELALDIMQNYVQESKSADHAKTKVKKVS